MSIVVKNIESFEIETTFQLSVIQETSVQLLVKRKTLDQSICMPKTHQMKKNFICFGNINRDNHIAECYEIVKVKNTNIHFQLDTRAKCSVLLLADLMKININLKVVPHFSPLKSFSGHYIRCAGTVILPCVCKIPLFLRII